MSRLAEDDAEPSIALTYFSAHAYCCAGANTKPTPLRPRTSTPSKVQEHCRPKFFKITPKLFWASLPSLLTAATYSALLVE